MDGLVEIVDVMDLENTMEVTVRLAHRFWRFWTTNFFPHNSSSAKINMCKVAPNPTSNMKIHQLNLKRFMDLIMLYVKWKSHKVFLFHILQKSKLNIIINPVSPNKDKTKYKLILLTLCL